MSKLETLGPDDPTLEQLVTPVEEFPSLETLYAMHAESLARTLLAAGVPDAYDAVQEAFVQAVVHWRKVSRYDDPLAWIRRVAINRLHDDYRHSIRKQIQRSAERADDGNDCTRSVGDMICDADRVVLPDYLAKVPGGREMVV